MRFLALNSANERSRFQANDSRAAIYESGKGGSWERGRGGVAGLEVARRLAGSSSVGRCVCVWQCLAASTAVVSLVRVVSGAALPCGSVAWREWMVARQAAMESCLSAAGGDHRGFVSAFTLASRRP